MEERNLAACKHAEFAIELEFTMKMLKHAEQRKLTLTFARIFHYNVRDFKQFERKWHLPVCCNRL